MRCKGRERNTNGEMRKRGEGVKRIKNLVNNTATPAAEIGFIYCRLSNSRDESCHGYSKIYAESAKQSKFASIFVCPKYGKVTEAIERGGEEKINKNLMHV